MNLKTEEIVKLSNKIHKLHGKLYPLLTSNFKVNVDRMELFS